MNVIDEEDLETCSWCLVEVPDDTLIDLEDGARICRDCQRGGGAGMMTLETKRIKCAHCKDYHGSIAEVKACATIHNAAKVFAPEPPVPPARPAHITLREQAKRDAVPEGRYAIEVDGDIKFYAVSKPTEGRWAGRTFVEREVSDDNNIPIKAYAARNVILDKIAADPMEAMLRYGRELKHCGHCGRKLRNKISREIGIGPVCRSRMGW